MFVPFWDIYASIYDILYPFWSTLSLATARNIIYLSHLQIYLSHPQFISVTCVTEKNWKQMKITESELQWYLGGLGSIRIIFEHFEITLQSLCIVLWYLCAVLGKFESCHCKQSNLSVIFKFISLIFNLSQPCSSQDMKWLKTAHTYHKLMQIDFKVISKCSYTILSDPKPPIYHCDSLTVIFSHFQFFSVIHMTEINWRWLR